MRRPMLLLIERPFIKKEMGEAAWVKVDATKIDSLGTYIFPHRYLPYAASITIDCIGRHIVNTSKHTTGILNKELEQTLLDNLNSEAIPFDPRDKSWIYSLDPARLKDQPFSNVNKVQRKDSEKLTDFLSSIVSKGLKSTGLRGNVDPNPIIDSDDESCESC